MATTIGSFDLASLKNLRDDVTQYFWFESNSSSAWGSGAHVTLYPESQFTNPNHANYLKGQNIIMNTDGFSIRNGVLPMMVLDNNSLDFNAVNTTQGTSITMATFGLTGAQIGQTSGAHIQISSSGLDVNLNSSTNIANFGTNGARIGKVDSAHSVIDADGQRFYASDGVTQLANIGYGEGQSRSGTATAPYYTFGVRQGTIGNYSMAEGMNTTSSNYASHAEGLGTLATGFTAHAEGYLTRATRNSSHAEGTSTQATKNDAHAEGYSTYAEGDTSHAEGVGTHARGSCSHTEGYVTSANGDNSHAEGVQAKAGGNSSHAEGYYTEAKGDYSHAQNRETIASRKSQTVIGEFNIEDTNGSDGTVRGNYAFIIGNGTANDSRSNALTVDWDGNVWASGTLRASTETPTISITASSGTLNNTVIRRFGNVVQLDISVRNTASTASGGNIFAGTISTTALRPLMVTTGASYYGSYAIGATISTAGAIAVRNADSRSLSAVTSNINISFTYIVA